MLKPLGHAYRKTALIHAVQWWKMGDHPAVKLFSSDPDTRDKDGNERGWVTTLEGGHIVTPGDWIATGVQGEHWPIKPDIFAKTYEVVQTNASPADAGLAKMREVLVQSLARRFCGWRLPKDFAPDNGISYQRPNYAPEVDATPTGTNLFTVAQAEDMFRDLLADDLT